MSHCKHHMNHLDLFATFQGSLPGQALLSDQDLQRWKTHLPLDWSAWLCPWRITGRERSRRKHKIKKINKDYSWDIYGYLTNKRFCLNWLGGSNIYGSSTIQKGWLLEMTSLCLGMGQTTDQKQEWRDLGFFDELVSGKNHGKHWYPAVLGRVKLSQTMLDCSGLNKRAPNQSTDGRQPICITWKSERKHYNRALKRNYQWEEVANCGLEPSKVFFMNPT